MGMMEAAKIMAILFRRQAYGDPAVLLDTLKDPRLIPVDIVLDQGADVLGL